MLLLLTAALAAEPVLGPDGWTWLGPVPDEGPRGSVVFDPDDCTVLVRAVDLDGGPGHRDVRLARVWADGAWRWADDWQVVDGTLRRPGRAPAALDGLRFGDEVLGVDAAGRVVSRARAGRTVEVLRDAAGAFVGMRSGPVEVRVDGDRGVASDGREVRWRREGGELRSVTDAGGLLAMYGYEDGRLARVTWDDAAALAIDAPTGTDARRTGTSGVGGRWRCVVQSAGRVAFDAPAGAWLVQDDGAAEVVTDPTGSTTRARRRDGRVIAWTDPRGGETRLVRDDRGRVTEVTDPSGARWGLTWGDAGLLGVTGPDTAAWTLTRDAAGAVASLAEPSGRSARWELDRGGVRAVGVGAAFWTVARDRAGRPTAVEDPAGSRVELVRGGDGRVSRVRDGGGGAWIIGRDARGAITSVVDPGGGAWAITRDGLGRAVAVTDPTGARTRWTLREDGLPGRVVVAGRHAWELLWTAAGALGGVRDPRGRVTGWSRDALGRARAVHRADGGALPLDRDAAGDLVRVGEVRVARDAAGRPMSVDLGLAWDRDPGGRVVGVTGPGVTVALAREPGGAVREVRVGGSAPVRLGRDAQGRVVRAEGEGAVVITRDAAGRIGAIERQGVTLQIARDVRGLPARLTLSGGAAGRAWTVGRDGAGRVVSFEGPGGLRLGVDRDPAGLPRLVRFPTNALARFTRDGDAVAVALEDRDGRIQAEVGWARGPSGALERLRAGLTWLLRRDPLDELVAAEAGEAVWSSAPDGVEGPGGAFVRYDARGRPAAAQLPAGWGGAWGLGEGELRYEVGDDGAIGAVAGPGGRVDLAYDGLGRLVAWRGTAGEGSVRRDALGRLVSVGRTALEGWGALLTRDGAVRAAVPGVGIAEPGGGTLLGPGGLPLLAVHGGVFEWAPQGPPAMGDAAAGGRYAAGLGLPALGLLDAVDPASGQPLGPTIAWPWAPRAWEARPAPSPWPDPDAAADVPWDDAPWAPGSPWADPLALLVALGELPDGGPRAASAPGLPWLPGSFAPVRPAPVPDPFALPTEDEPLVAWIVALASAPTRAPAPSDVTSVLLGAALEPWWSLPPGLVPALPPELRGPAER